MYRLELISRMLDLMSSVYELGTGIKGACEMTFLARVSNRHSMG